jgi:hypothetical protein
MSYVIEISYLPEYGYKVYYFKSGDIHKYVVSAFVNKVYFINVCFLGFYFTLLSVFFIKENPFAFLQRDFTQKILISSF